MARFHLRTLVLGLPLCILAAGQGLGAHAAQPSGPAAPQAAAAQDSEIEPEAVEALKNMSRFLMSLNTAAITSRGSLDVVTDDGQRIQLDGVTDYKLRKPGFTIDYTSDIKKRRFFYDGKHFTIYAPESGFYATVPAPATNREALDEIYNHYGVKLPLEDLFRWADPNQLRIQALQSAYDEGTATLDGIKTNHFSFREKDVDWEVWIQQGAQPLPRKLVIVDRTDPARPTFIARLDWKVNPSFADGEFVFTPDKNSKQIELATFEGPGE